MSLLKDVGLVALGYAIRGQVDKSNTTSVRQALDNWVKTVCKHNADHIVSLYAPDGVLLGTISKDLKKGRKEIQTYFDRFVLSKPCGKITEVDIKTRGNIAVVDGMYTFELYGEQGIEKVPARFTFVFENRNGKWLILSHHSSAVPKQ